MHCRCTDYIIDNNGEIDHELSNNFNKHAGCWYGDKHIIFLRTKVFRNRCKGHTPKERNKYIVKIISHELGHELYNNHNYSLKELHVPTIQTDYAKSYRKFDKDLYIEETYADSMGIYVASKLYPDTEDIQISTNLYKEGVSYFDRFNSILVDY